MVPVAESQSELKHGGAAVNARPLAAYGQPVYRYGTGMMITHSYSAPPEANRALSGGMLTAAHGGGPGTGTVSGAKHLTCGVTGVSQRHISL